MFRATNGVLSFTSPYVEIGVAQLGLIAGSGMLIAFLCTITFLPAAITLCRVHDEDVEIGFAWHSPAATEPILVLTVVRAAGFSA